MTYLPAGVIKQWLNRLSASYFYDDLLSNDSNIASNIESPCS